MNKTWLNGVEAYAGLAAVDAYIGATQISGEQGMEYGGSHVIEDLIAGKQVKLKGEGYGTDCYPKRQIETEITLDDINQAFMFNPRNNYQRYVAASNTTERTLHTYMGTLLPNLNNVNYAGTGEISPLNNDPLYKTIGTGTRIFLGGAQGYVVSEGTQHSPTTGFGTLAVSGNLKDMSTDYVRGAVMEKYGTTLLVGIGIPIPILDKDIALATAVKNQDIITNILDYGVPRRDRPVLKKVDYAELMSGQVSIGEKTVKTASMSSFRIAYDIMEKLTDWIESKEMFLSEPALHLPQQTKFNPMKTKSTTPKVSKVMTKPVITINVHKKLKDVSALLVENNIDQVPVVDDDEKLVGIITSWDITRATAQNKNKLVDVMTSHVLSSSPDELIDEVSQKLLKKKIGSTPIIDNENKVIGIITLSDINKVLGRMIR